MRRFLFLALPTLVLTMALFHSGVEALGHAQLPHSPSVAARWWMVIEGCTWVLEALALSALYALVQSGGGGRLLNGLLTGWIAWVFRGPLLVIAVVTLGDQPAGPWWRMTFSWWILYSVCGLLLGVVAVAAGLKPVPAVPAAPPQPVAPRAAPSEPGG